MPIPDDCSDRYAAGWAYADWFIIKGGNLNADAPGDWQEGKAVGFWDRLTAEREAWLIPASDREKARDTPAPFSGLSP